MAFRRCLCTRANLIARQCHPSISIFGYTDDRKNQHVDEDSVSHENISNFLQKRSFGTSINGTPRSSFFAHGRRYPNTFLSPTAGSFFSRYMSSTIDEESEYFEFMSDAAQVITDTTVQSATSQAAVANEVAIAAADSFLPVKALMYFIDGVHSFTGLNWWACIVLTTLLIHVATFPLAISQLKSRAKLKLLLSSPRVKDIMKEMNEKGKDRTAIAEAKEKWHKILKEFGVSLYAPFHRIFIQGTLSISLLLAVSNMAEKMPSFKNGGAFWFVDLTTPDTMYIFPALTVLTFLINLEVYTAKLPEGNPVAGSGTVKNMLRGFAITSVHLFSICPKAMFCYFVTHNLISLAYRVGLNVPGVKEALGVPKTLMQKTKRT